MSTTKDQDSSSVFSKGGGGNVFETSVQTAFVITLLLRGKMPGLPTAEIIEVAFQSTRLGYHTDDVLVKLRSHQGEHRLLAQIKHELTISAQSTKFEEVMTALWRDFTNSLIFNPNLDRLLIIKSALTQVDRQDTITLLDWAKSKASANDFYLEVNRIEKKKKALAVLAEVLQKANNGFVLDEGRIWQFLRCLVLLEYDFGKESSVSETNYLNLIELAKNQNSTTSAKGIWDSIESHIARLNKDGGSISIETVKAESFATHFDPSLLFDSYASIKKIQDDSGIIFGPLKSTIAGFHISRPDLRDKLETLLNNQKLTIVTGEPGVGKSALVKEVISGISSNTAVLVFKADQFNQPHLSQVFTSLGVSDCLKDLSTFLAAIPKKLIVIDSFEKLLEGDPDNAFRQLMYLMEGVPDVRIIATSRTYAVELLNQKYALGNASSLEVPLLTDGENGEFEEVLTEFPKLRQLATNKQLRQVLRSPKYLDYAVQWLDAPAQDVSGLTLTEFKKRLWQHIVENHAVIHNGMPAKRNKAFMEIALLRAQQMSLYAEPNQADETAIYELVKDNVLTRQSDENKFAPSHDILEDWALVKHIRRLREKQADPKPFYELVGNRPALRRAFRLWVEESLSSQAATVFELVRQTQREPEIERYWADEVLIAIFRSDQSKAFFEEFETELLQDQAQFLQRAIDLLRTACREHEANGHSNLLFPIGSGWEAVLSFVQGHFNQLKTLRSLISGLLVDWSTCFYKYPRNISLDEIEPVKQILFSYLEEIERREQIWFDEQLKTRTRDLTEISFLLTEYAKEEVNAILVRAIPSLADQYDYYDKSFYGEVRTMVLSGIYSRLITKHLPEQVIAIAKEVWISNSLNKKIEHDHPFQRIHEEREEDDLYSFGNNKSFGLNDDINDYPSGIFKTPVYNLLLDNLELGVDFLIEMVNHCTNHYVKTRRGQSEGVLEVQLQLLDGHLVKQYGSNTLWQAYRGATGSSDLLGSLLMSLESYLLLTAETKSVISQKNLKFLFRYLLKNSHSVATSSVLASVAMAYPKEVGEAVIPLLSVREFYEWDMNRALLDLMGAFAPIDLQNSYAQEAQIKSNQLPHRKKYVRGLKEFVIEFQFNLRISNKILFGFFDRMWAESSEQDIQWRKTLHEIDTRKWQITDVSHEEGTFAIEPNYESTVQQMVDDYKSQSDFNQEAALSTAWIQGAYEKKDGIKANYKRWEEIYDRFQIEDNTDTILDRPVTFAILGLRDLSDALSHQQRTWCIETTLKVISLSVLKSKSQNEKMNSLSAISPFDRQVALTSFPLLIKKTHGETKQKNVILLLFQVLTAHFSNHEMQQLLTSLREKLWEIDKELANSIWQDLIHFSQIRKSLEKASWSRDENLIASIDETERKFIEKASWIEKKNNFDSQYIKFTEWHSHFLVRAFLMLPYDNQEMQHIDFRIKLVSLYLKALNKDFDQEEEKYRRMLIFTQDQSILKYGIRDYFLYCDHDAAADMVEVLLNNSFQLSSSEKYYHNDSYNFIYWTLRMMISELGQIVYNSPRLIGDKVIANFWRIWERLYSTLENSNKRLFVDLLFLEIEWDKEWTDWLPMQGKKAFFKKVTERFGQYNVLPLINLMSSVGDQTLLPEGLHWLVNVVKTHPNNLPALASSKSEAFITRLYQRHIKVIKSDTILLNDFIWLLDKMVDSGSSRAYITRENLITYK